MKWPLAIHTRHTRAPPTHDFRVCKVMDIPEYLKLALIKVRRNAQPLVLCVHVGKAGSDPSGAGGGACWSCATSCRRDSVGFNVGLCCICVIGVLKPALSVLTRSLPPRQEIGVTHMRVVEGLTSRLQLEGMAARMCKAANDAKNASLAQ